MGPTVYIETSIISYLTGRPTSDVVQAAHQRITRQWWKGRTQFDLCVSEFVLWEASHGDPTAARRRARALSGLPVLALTNEATVLAAALARESGLPRKAVVDAFHIAVATVHGADYLLTWNCRHIANAAMRGTIERVCRSEGFVPPVICTPEELSGSTKP
jgi:predicted nucleic acid-binding protein